jgi:hypothetical protein
MFSFIIYSYSSLYIVRIVIRWAWYVASVGDMRNVYIFLIGEPAGKSPLERCRCEGVDWICLAQDRVQWRAAVKTVMKLWVSQKVGNLVTI